MCTERLDDIYAVIDDIEDRDFISEDDFWEIEGLFDEAAAAIVEVFGLGDDLSFADCLKYIDQVVGADDATLVVCYEAVGSSLASLRYGDVHSSDFRNDLRDFCKLLREQLATAAEH